MSFAFAVVYEDTVTLSIMANCYDAGYDSAFTRKNRRGHFESPQIKVKIMILYTRGIGMFSSPPLHYFLSPSGFKQQ